MPPSFVNGLFSVMPPSTSAPDGPQKSPSPTHLNDSQTIASGAVRRPPRKSSRPMTAPAKEEIVLLPSADPIKASRTRMPFGESTLQSPINGTGANGKLSVTQSHMQTVSEDDAESLSGSQILCYLPSPFENPSSETSLIASDDITLNTSHSDCDWATFINAYALGRWNPNRTPNPPHSCQQSISDDLSFHNEHSRPTPRLNISQGDAVDIFSEPSLSVDILPSQEIYHSWSEGQATLPSSSTEESSTTLPSLSAIPLSPGPSISPNIPYFGSRSSIPLNLPISHRMRKSFSTSTPKSLGDSSITHTFALNADVQTSAATLRWAAARVDISPLALPSPEHELTDPMRGVTATIPGSHPPESHMNDSVITPGGTRKSRLASFWQGTTDIDNGGATHSAGPTKLATIKGSPSEAQTESVDTVVSPNDSVINDSSVSAIDDPALHLGLLSLPPPASAPVLNGYHGSAMTTEDYFGDVKITNSAQDNTGDVAVVNQETMSGPLADISLREVVTVNEISTSVPALPRRVCLTRQTSSPLPASSPSPERRLTGGRVISDGLVSFKNSRSLKEEQMFSELGYLAPPYPPDELERRRALYKFNIWNTGPDLNFDRIAHLAKLVFNTKGVVISLIDSNEQWFKSEWGIKTTSCSRAHSFCGHAILHRGDEPMIVLDAQRDWRFSKNPLVTGSPRIRFYAGAPLRTQDGFNIGTLAVVDDIPREEFAPRQRHTLKEFAAIAMREMELWRDKIQLRIRDRIQNSMEQFSRECLEIDTEVFSHGRPDLIVGSSMDKVYDRAAKLVKRTLDVEGVIVMDVSHSEVLESMSAEGSVSVTLHHGDPNTEMTKRQLSTEEYHKLQSFFSQYPDGKVSEGIMPPSFRFFLPTHIQYALTVPIYNIDKRPFALLCAYNANDHTRRFLEGHELSYLRAIGVIILSAVLKRRMILADKAKSLFISNISHELRTPLHGILAAAELLGESSLNHSQSSFLQTVQACGTSLVETVNHVLDFTKLSGNSKAGGVENVIVSSKVDLMQLVEEAVDGCWIGHRARTATMGDSGIGSVYSPPREDQGSPIATRRKHVETIVDIGHRPEGWVLRCEKGGIRRVLMNLFGNSLKFTSDGFVHVNLRQLPNGEGDPPEKVKIELCVFDSGKGISQNFLKNQLFHPFSQENPLQTGTGLGLAIVSSIVTSESVGGKVDVWSEEGVGTEIKVSFSADIPDEPKSPAIELEPFKFENGDEVPSISLVGFDSQHKGISLLKNVISTYLVVWWGLQINADPEKGGIVILNEDPSSVIAASERHDTSRPFIILSAARGNPAIMAIASEHERIGGFCRILYKPGGPTRLRSILKLCIHASKFISKSHGTPPQSLLERADSSASLSFTAASHIPRRNSDENQMRSRQRLQRPSIPRSTTANPVPLMWQVLPSTEETNETPDSDTSIPTISIGPGGSLLKSSIGSIELSMRRFRVLVVEDNSILRNLLTKWLSNKGYDFRHAVDGRDGVTTFAQEGPFDVILLDLSMPVLDGVAATAEIRKIESARSESSDTDRSRILALTGMSSLEDKRRAFEAGVDGYLVKPVAFKTLDEMFHKLGMS